MPWHELRRRRGYSSGGGLQTLFSRTYGSFSCVQGMAIVKTLNGPRERKQVSMVNQSKESKLTKQIMENLERKKTELLFDNEALAKSYDVLQHQLESLTSQYKKAVQLFLAQYVYPYRCSEIVAADSHRHGDFRRKNLEGDAEELEKLASAPIDDFTPMPFNMATKEGIPQYISESMAVLEEKLKQLEHVIRNELPSAEARSDKEVIKRLRQKLDDAHAIITDQDQLLQASLSSPAVAVRVGGERRKIGAKPDTHSVRSRAVRSRSSPDAIADEDVEEEKSALTLLRKNLENERKLLQEQAGKLDKDRLAFEIAKRDHLFGSPKESIASSCEQALPTVSDSDVCSTPKRQRRAKCLDMDGPGSPIEIPVSGKSACSFAPAGDSKAVRVSSGVDDPQSKQAQAADEKRRCLASTISISGTCTSGGDVPLMLSYVGCGQVASSGWKYCTCTEPSRLSDMLWIDDVLPLRNVHVGHHQLLGPQQHVDLALSWLKVFFDADAVVKVLI
ncbi:unnamed protein product [Phytophthora fragariaefolia]|uniref:Unnamed protein product n=1 Tax=Phytophthora fragariaefolia TaxID=1490495 RepID=A0A9W6XTR2_9STRA|nr:unnamed protein product [Phytophthora fragariaefolia]